MNQPKDVRVLLVEDEVLVRMFAVDALEDGGFKVDQAGSGADALTLLRAHVNDITAVVIDLGLPDVQGDEVAAEMRKLRADMPILIASGRSERELRDKFFGDARVAVLTKPYTSSLLLDALASIGVKGAAV